MYKIFGESIMLIRRLIAKAGVAVTRQSTFERLVSNERLLDRNANFIAFGKHLSPEILEHAIALLPESRSEIFQDIFVALMMSGHKPGYFVEFGATDGVDGNNTWMFEKHLGWTGLLAEPAHVWRTALHNNRRADISEKCVWKESGASINFIEAKEAGLSTLAEFVSIDRHAERRLSGKSYLVDSISLNDLLAEYDAPGHIDYMSIDTEGSEYEILSRCDFERWTFGVVTVEHNFRPDRESIYDLLTSYGYVRAPTALSKFDDWYVSAALVPKLNEVVRRQSVDVVPKNNGENL